MGNRKVVFKKNVYRKQKQMGSQKNNKAQFVFSYTTFVAALFYNALMAWSLLKEHRYKAQFGEKKFRAKILSVLQPPTKRSQHKLHILQGTVTVGHLFIVVAFLVVFSCRCNRGGNTLFTQKLDFLFFSSKP